MRSFASLRKSRRALHLAAGERDALDVAVIGAAAAAQHVDLRMTPQQLAILAAQLHRIAGIEIG